MSEDFVTADDGLPASKVGQWSLEKHDRLRRYVDISRAVRNKYTDRAGATYIDLYCGPGRSLVRETGKFIDGSPLVATTKAAESHSGFTRVFISDAARICVEAASARLNQRGFAYKANCGSAAESANVIARELNKYALHFAFLDPYNLIDLPFAIIREFSRFQRMDMLVHVSVQDLQRNLRRYVEAEDGPLEAVVPGWRRAIDVRQRDDIVRKELLQYWLGLIRKLDMAPSEGIELVSGSKNQRLYWLVFISRHELAGNFWDKIRNVTGQGRLDI